MTAHEIMAMRRKLRQFLARLVGKPFYGYDWGCEYCALKCWASSDKWCNRGEFYVWRKCGITDVALQQEIDRDRAEKERQSVEQYKDACDNEQADGGEERD